MDKAEKFIRENNIELGEKLDGTPFYITDDEVVLIKICQLLDEYAQQVKERYAYQQAMEYEEWLCKIGATKTISARPDYTDFFKQQNQQ